MNFLNFCYYFYCCRYVEYAKNETYVRSQDYFQVLGFISNNPVGNPIVWKFFRNEWPYLVNRFTLYHRIMGTFIASVTNSFSTEVELEEVRPVYFWRIHNFIILTNQNCSGWRFRFTMQYKVWSLNRRECFFQTTDWLLSTPPHLSKIFHRKTVLLWLELLTPLKTYFFFF